MPALALVLALLCATPASHPSSLSFSRIAVRGAELRHTIRVQRTSVLEELPLDLDLDGWIQEEELELGRRELELYLAAHYVFRTESGGVRGAGVRLAGTLERVSTTVPSARFDEQWLELELVYRDATPIEELLIEVSLFERTSPGHRDDAEIVLNAQEHSAHTFWRVEPTLYVAPGNVPRERRLVDWVRHGADHIATGFDHIAFLVALLVGATSLRTLVGIVSAFTVAHSATLALAALDVVAVPARPVELLIALSIAYVAAGNLLYREPRRLWVEAFFFGLVHGLGFAGFLRESLLDEADALRTLVGFNLGVELGQLAIVVTAALLLRVLPGSRRGAGRATSAPGASARAWLAPRWLRLGTSGLVLVLGLYWFVERAWLTG